MPLIACPDCARLVSDSAPACLGCGRPIAGFTSQPPVATTTMIALPRSVRPWQVSTIALAGILLVSALGVAGALWWRASHGDKTAQAATTGPGGGAGPVRAGEIGVLRGTGTPTIILFESRDDFDAAAKASAAKDEVAWKQLVRSRATFVASGSKAKRIDAAAVAPPGAEAGIQVRVIEGPHVGFVGWTGRDNLVAN